MALQREKVQERAQQLLQKGLVEKAVAELQALLLEYPNDVRTRLRVGDLQSRCGDVAGSIASYTRVASDYTAQGFFLKAVAVTKQLIKLDTAQPAHYNSLADLYLRLTMPQDALAAHRQALELHERFDRLDEIEATLQKILAIDPTHAPARVRLAEVYVRTDQLAKAKAAFLAAFEHLKQQGRDDECLRVLERLCFLEPTDVAAAVPLARLYLQRGEAQRALGPLQPCFRHDAKQPEVLNAMVDAFVALNQQVKAAKVLRQLVSVLAEAGAPAESDHAAAAARLQEMMGSIGIAGASGAQPGGASEPDAAVRQSIEAETFGASDVVAPRRPGDNDRLLAEAESYARLGLLHKALHAVREVLADEPERRDAQDRLVKLLRVSHTPDEAVQLLWRRAQAAERAGQLPLAVEDLQVLLEIEPQHPEAQALYQAVAHRNGGVAPTAPSFSEVRHQAPGAPADAPLVSSMDDVEPPTGAPQQNGETHYNLGITYKEMGLFDEALGEFAKARQQPELATAAQTMVGLCQLQRGQVDLARQIFAQLCAAPQRSAADRLQLRYEIALAYEAMGRFADAAAFFEDIKTLDPSYRDAAARLDNARKHADASAQTVSGELDLAALEQGPAATGRSPQRSI